MLYTYSLILNIQGETLFTHGYSSFTSVPICQPQHNKGIYKINETKLLSNGFNYFAKDQISGF